MTDNELEAPQMARINETVVLEGLAAEDGLLTGATLIRAGVSKNRTHYQEGLLAASTSAFEGLPAYFGHQVAPGGRPDVGGKSDPRNIAGTWTNVRYESNALKADMRILPATREVIEAARATGDLIGLSIDMAAEFRVKRQNGELVREVTSFRRDPMNSVDVVVNPAAGGRLFESVTDSWWTQYEEQTMADDIRDAETVVQTQQETAPTTAPPIDNKAMESELEKARSLREQAAIELSGIQLERRLTEARLPADFDALVRKDFAGRAFEMADLEARITETKAAIDKLTESGKVRENGGQVEVGREDWDKRGDALLGLFTGQKENDVQPFRSFKEAYFKCNPGKDYLTSGFEILADTQIRGYDSARETLLTSDWASIFASTMHRAVIREFNSGSDQHWRALASDITSISDFRTNYRLHQGGFGVLSTVTENGTYQELANPGDDAESYAISKRGNLFQITLEAIANDDVGAIRRIPRDMGKAARITLNRDILAPIDQAAAGFNPTMGDSTKLFHSTSVLRGGDGSNAASGNLATTALSAAQLDARRINMLKRATYGNTVSSVKMDPGAIVPKIIIVSPTLQQTAWKLAESEVSVTGGTAGQNNSTEPNFFRQFGYNVLCVEHFTDTNSWALVADPRSAPTLEVGFYQGRQEPDIFTRDEFTKDALTYKIRFIYGFVYLEPLAWDYSDVAN